MFFSKRLRRHCTTLHIRVKPFYTDFRRGEDITFKAIHAYSNILEIDAWFACNPFFVADSFFY